MNRPWGGQDRPSYLQRGHAGLDGSALLKRAKPFLCDAKVIFISGYSEAEFSDLLEGEDVTLMADRLQSDQGEHARALRAAKGKQAFDDG